MSRHDARRKFGAEIQALVDAAPPLTPAQRAQLTAILNSGRSAVRGRPQYSAPVKEQDMPLRNARQIPTVAIENVTPEMADKWLGTQAVNRHLRDNRVMNWIGVIARGEWELTNDCISFDVDGKLLNGQHRLTAIVVSGETLPLCVLRGLPPAVQDVMDTGLARVTGDALRMRGEKNVFALASGLRWEVRMRYIEQQAEEGNNVAHFDPDSTPTTKQLLRLFDQGPEPWRESAAFIQKSCARFKMRPGPNSMLHWRTRAIDQADADIFWERYITGVGLEEENDPILQLRNVVVRARSRTRGLANPLSDYREVAITAKAWNLWRDGDRVGTLVWHFGGTQHDTFPIPR